jgi:hypothetical protein
MPDLSPIQLIIVLSYFIPAIVAFARGHHNKWAILALDLLTGWTAIGWVAALVWALTSPSSPRAAPPAASIPPGARFDPQTGRPIRGFDPQTGEPIFDDPIPPNDG